MLTENNESRTECLRNSCLLTTNRFPLGFEVFKKTTLKDIIGESIDRLEFQVHYVHPHSSDLHLDCSVDIWYLVNCVKD